MSRRDPDDIREIGEPLSVAEVDALIRSGAKWSPDLGCSRAMWRIRTRYLADRERYDCAPPPNALGEWRDNED